MGFFEKIFGTKNDRELKVLMPRVAAINALESRISVMNDDGLASRIQQLKQEISAQSNELKMKNPGFKKEHINAILDPHLHEVFAIVREAGKRVMNMRHFDVQLMGGMILNSGKIAEMKTGEGKTLVATLPAVLNSLTGLGVHVVTINDYLASRDAEWMGRIYRFLGLKVGVVVPQISDRVKQDAYQSDITYGQNNEFGFDYLRDNMKFSLSEYMQRDHVFAIVDEVDSILIDEARTPLIISGPSEEGTDKYLLVNSIIPRLRKDSDFSIDEKSRAVMLTEAGIEKAEKLLSLQNLYDPANMESLHHLNQALRAHAIYKRDVDYVIERGEVVIVDEHTGRLMYGRRWSDSLHQAIEAKENVKIQAENQTLATITFQNYFRMYKKLSGMTGTADTEAEEFAKIYDLDVIVSPTNRPMVRVDENDQVFKSEREKIDRIVEDINQSHAKGQPVLVGTVSVEKSEVLSKRLHKLGINHDVLNAKKHRDEAGIVAQAGRAGGVTIATNMAGRGTDIILGGDPEFMARTAVAQHFHQGDQQIAEYAFLTGKPSLINVEKLALRDSNDTKYLAKLEAEVELLTQQMDEARKKGEVFPELENLPKTFEEAQKQIFDERKAFYIQAVERYTHELEKVELVTSAEKGKVLAAGGLRIVGTERHESRRIDNQLRGRAGRQGDPGSSCFYMSLEDDLMRIFGSERMISVMERLGMEEGVPIEHPWVTKSIANAQKRVEGFHFDSRKQLIEYDDVMNQQRQAVYSLRRKVLGGENIRTLIFDLVEKAVINLVTGCAPEKTSPNEWKVGQLTDEVSALFGVRLQLPSNISNRDDLLDEVYRPIEQFYVRKESNVGPELVRQVERVIYLQTIDHLWREHLQAMDHLREGIHFRGYAQKDPKQEYKKEGFTLFLSMMTRIRDEVIEKVFKAEIHEGSRQKVEQDLRRLAQMRQQEAERLQREQVLVHQSPGVNAEPPRLALGPTLEMTAQRPLREFGRRRQEPQGPNRQQRRSMKSHEKKEKR